MTDDRRESQPLEEVIAKVEMVEAWPLLKGTNDGALPRIIPIGVANGRD